MDRHNGEFIGAKPYVDVNWTKGIDQKTGKPIDYDPSKEIQTYAGVGNLTPGEPLKRVCPSIQGGNNYWPSSYNPRTKLIYIPAMTGCMNVEIDRAKHNAERGRNGGNATSGERFESNLTAVDPVTQEIKKSVHLRYPNFRARFRPVAASCSSACLTARLRPSTKPRSTNCGRSMSAPGFRRRP
jgi:alcohol dehydrogenase (cytochrome c)